MHTLFERLIQPSTYLKIRLLRDIFPTVFTRLKRKRPAYESVDGNVEVTVIAHNLRGYAGYFVADEYYFFNK